MLTRWSDITPSRHSTNMTTTQHILAAFQIQYEFPYSQDAMKQLKEADVYEAIDNEPFLIVMDMERQLQEAGGNIAHDKETFVS